MRKIATFRPTTILAFLLAAAAVLGLLPAPEASAKEEANPAALRREVYFESEESYPQLPELVATTPASHPAEWSRRQYGVDENPRGIIGSEVVSYFFLVPEGWKVTDATRSSSTEGKTAIFSLEGDTGIRGAIFKVDPSAGPLGDEKELARYFMDRRADFLDLLDGINGAEVEVEDHLLQGFARTGSETITQYESYSSLKLSRGRYASLTQYRVAANRGYVIDIYVPVREFDGRRRTTAYLIGKSFIAHRFG